MSGRLEQDNRSDGIHVAEFRRRYFKNGSYAGMLKVKERYRADGVVPKH